MHGRESANQGLEARLTRTWEWLQSPMGRVVALVAGIAFLGAVLPAVPLFLGVFLLVAVGLHALMPDLRPYIDTLLRIPVGKPSHRRALLMMRGGVGLLLILAGTLGATVRGHLRGQWRMEQESELHE